MELRIDFYSKEEFSIQMDFSGRYPFPENQTSELFLLACFTLRQLSNLAQHPVAQALAGFLVTNDYIEKIFQNDNQLPKSERLISQLISHAGVMVLKSYGKTESYQVTNMLRKEMNYDNLILETIDRDIITKIPELVQYRGKGKKSFEVTLPPFFLKMSGFGIFGGDANHHAFHSVIGLIRFLGLKHSDDKVYLSYLTQVSNECGTLYVLRAISADQVASANEIIQKIGIS